MAKIGRNDPCPCGSGKKYKKCHPGAYDPGRLLLERLPTQPVVACYIAEDYREMGLSPVIVVRRHPDVGKLVIALFMCDIFCLGVKDVLFEPTSNFDRLRIIIETQPQDMVEIPYSEAREIILGSIKYAESLGFSPHTQYEAAKYSIECDKPFSYHRKYFGLNGKPFYYTGPNDNYRFIFSTLERSCGKGGFEYEIDERCTYVYEGRLVE